MRALISSRHTPKEPGKKNNYSNQGKTTLSRSPVVKKETRAERINIEVNLMEQEVLKTSTVIFGGFEVYVE
jgi:hypothetical protein